MNNSEKSTVNTFEDIQKVLTDNSYKVIGNKDAVGFNNAGSLDEADKNSVSWISPKNSKGIEQAVYSEACLIVCKSSLEIPDDLKAQKCFILVDNPKLVFSEIITELIQKKPSAGIHPTAYVHEDAEISPDAYIGPFTYAGRCKIGPGSIIWGQCYIHDGVTMGRNVEIHAGCIIGDDGSGYSKNEKGEWIKFPHIGSTIIEDNVEVGANSYINKGALGNTLIKKGAVIGNSVCIGHNVEVGENSIVLANSLLCGSSKTAEGVYIAPSAVIKNQLKIGANATVGMGAVVLKNVPENSTVIGNPAVSIEEYRKWSSFKAKLFRMFGKTEGS